jgi:O-antigen ligase
MESPSFKARILSSVETGETAGRTDIWTESVRLFMDSPIYGFGYRMHQFKLGERTGHEQRGTHNLFLSVLLGSGLLGFSLFLYFYAHSFKAIWSHKAEGVNPIVFAWFLMALAGSLTINTEIAKWFWLVVALAISAGNQSRSAASIRKNQRQADRGTIWREPAIGFPRSGCDPLPLASVGLGMEWQK